ncbi:RtcB family protein [Paenibacillus thiaminolyticus]|uniref:tRNA-splicing ligase RtcB n=1 Tax=Paenibacillus thiaminolyticus TaxID=49283 RepID=A0AAP9DQV2_PANTH|nr:RtcB family protein [Paenibacillus thiaminolyticus]MCY9537319.1 RtcB family protein [Paenibacillus thiaminolyticus]MCY9603637.1 RtcB family protein [Paenibacillus thiaminolyticus]MCY9606751.1 RtcB family protein [Paenibacillus thiaminolyticus]MCY9612829.1 RtcB family protein [Paenibacillus thiaminolyticus]MCY9619681.1 RtcB family protein [Paenibacillus thiaminolyticus]
MHTNHFVYGSDLPPQECYYRTVELPAGTLHVYANNALYQELGAKVFEMANNNLQIPNRVYMSYTPDVHVGVGTCIGTTAVWNASDGYVSPSIVGSDIGCGMRVHLTNVHRDDLQDVKLRRKLVKAIEKLVPVDSHARGHFSDIRLEHVLVKGLHGLPKKYVPDSYTPKKMTSLTHVEHSKFGFDTEMLNEMPAVAWHRAHRQLGTLGGGNHFAEIQAVEIEESNRDTAEAWGLFDGQVIIMIHSGSRAWGGAVSQQCSKEMAQWMRTAGAGTADPRLVFAPLAEPVAERYVHLMYSALNYAVVNRHLMAFGIREAFRDVLGPKVEMTTLYDLMHNYAWEESHDGRRMFVHRKGATRALPPHHPDNPKPYAATGHPALIPGSMGSASYLMAGRDTGAANYYSICHGAGRVRSRSATKQLVTVDEFAASLQAGTEDEVVVNQRMLESIIDEAPQAYKDVEQIIESVVGAGLAGVVARCKPLATVKGG